jgi:hypothetical protein
VTELDIQLLHIERREIPRLVFAGTNGGFFLLGRYLATISDSNTVRVWFLRQDDLIEEACRRLSRNLSEEDWRRYVGDDAYRKTCPKLP